MTDATQSSTRIYLAIWGWLAGLMLLGVVLAELPIPKLWIILMVLALSSVKALLVALYYMHLKMDRRLLLFVAVAPLVIIALALSVVFSSFFIQL
jgi:caa(3)-type oxidase subunit IV